MKAAGWSRSRHRRLVELLLLVGLVLAYLVVLTRGDILLVPVGSTAAHAATATPMSVPVLSTGAADQ